MNIGILIQARSGSTRLPNKILLPFFNNKSILNIIIEKLLFLNNNYPIILNTTTSINDNVFTELSSKYNIKIFRGSEHNVLDRFIQAGNHYNFDKVLRICSDNPFLDIHYLNKIIDIINNNKHLDYCSFKTANNIPVIKTHLGLFAEAVSLSSLEKTSKLTQDKYYTEHVTNFIYENPKLFNVHLEKLDEKLDRKDLRFTIDNKIDFDNLKEIFKYYKKNNYNIESTINFIDDNDKYKSLMIKNINKYSK